MSPVNVPRRGPAHAPLSPPDRGLDGDVLALAFSGGGARSAAFSYGALLALRDQRRTDGVRLIDRLAFVSGVSGGTLSATWFGLHGPDGLDEFAPAFLDKDWQATVRTNLIEPSNWIRFARGGLNGRDRMADWLDREVYQGATMGDLSGPPVIVNAVELYTGLPFVFAPPWFDALCSDLDQVRIADAVAASAAYPIAVRPVVLESYGQTCDSPLASWVDAAIQDRTGSALEHDTAQAFRTFRDPSRLRYLHLLDGGVVDNFGLSGIAVMQRASGLPYGPLLSAGDAVRIRSLHLIVVNGERTSTRTWGLDRAGPGGRGLTAAIADHSPDAARRNAYDAFLGHLARWEKDTIAWRCALSPEAAQALGAGPDWNCADLSYSAEIIGFADLPPDQTAVLRSMPTRYSLPHDSIAFAIEAGRSVMMARADAIPVRAACNQPPPHETSDDRGLHLVE